MRRSLVSYGVVALMTLLISACDPLAPVPTPTAQTLIVTPEATMTSPPTETPLPSPSPLPTSTPPPSPTPTPLACLSAGGRVIAIDDLRSETISETLGYRVYVPPCYFELQQRYPVLILIHGLRQTERIWEDIGLIDALDRRIADGSLPPMLVVMTRLGQIGTREAFPPNPSYESYIVRDLLPAIERDFCTWNRREQRAIGGISRGGFWAYSIALRNPDLFASVGGHSAAFDIISPAAFSPLELALDADRLIAADLRMYLDNGAEDPAGVELTLFSSRLSARGVPHTYIITPVGGHTNEYWSGQVDEYLDFYARPWMRAADALPTCLQPSP